MTRRSVRSWVLEARKISGAMFAQGQAVVIHAAGVSRSGLEVIHALLQGTLDHGDGFSFPAMRSQDALAAQAEDRDRLAGSTEKAAWDGRVR